MSYLSYSKSLLSRDKLANFSTVGLNSVDEDGQHAKYYWMFSWMDETAVEKAGKDYWTMHTSKEESLEYAIRETEEWDPKFREIIQLTKPEGMMVPPLVIRDMEPLPLQNKRITLLGDAAHPMTPCRLNDIKYSNDRLTQCSSWRGR